MKIYFLFNSSIKLPAHGSGEKTHNSNVCEGFTRNGHVVFTLNDAQDVLGKNDYSKSFYRNIYSYLKKALPKSATDWLRDLYMIMDGMLGSDRIYRKIKNTHADIVYERITAFHTSGVKAAKRLGIPYVLEMHEMHNCVGFNERVNFNYVRKKMWLHNAKNADLVVVVSKYLKKYLIDYGVDENKILVNPNAVDTTLFHPECGRNEMRRKLGINDEFVIGFVGGMFKYHGIHYLPELSKYLNANNIKHKIVLVGNMANYSGGLSGYEKNLKMMNVFDNFIITGPVNLSEVPSYLSTFDIGLMPDSNEYGSPLKIFEYGAMRLPVVAPSYGPICEVIEDGISGLLFEPRSVISMGECIKELYCNTALSKEISVKLNKIVVKEYSWVKYTYRIESTINRIVNTHVIN